MVSMGLLMYVLKLKIPSKIKQSLCSALVYFFGGTSLLLGFKALEKSESAVFQTFFLNSERFFTFYLFLLFFGGGLVEYFALFLQTVFFSKGNGYAQG